MAYNAVYWKDELHRYKEDYRKFTEQGRKVVKRYRDVRKDTDFTDARFNILWSNIKTLKPAIYSRAPKVEVSRRFKDRNDIGRVASMILERTIDYELRQYSDYHSAMSHSVEDRLLPGRGVAWLRYEPKIETVEEPQITDDVEDEGYAAGQGEGDLETNGLAGEDAEPLEKVTDERTPVDYVFWEDFAHLPARTWEEVTWVGRRVYMSQEEGVERFGDIFKDVPLTHSPDKDGEDMSTTEALKKAPVWEIWCKSSKKVYWIADHFEEILDEVDDPLELESFFPCPKPLFATVTSDSLIPVADFKMYQDQADEIDDITGRIQHLTRALKVMGIYAADEPALARLMKEGNDAVMVPVTNWPAFVEKGGLNGAVQFLPLTDVVNSLTSLYRAREACKQIIYETTGISDILRGASVASETATAQQIKSQFASIRLNDMKDDVARFARDLLRMKAEVICSKYQPEIILEVSGIANTPDGQNPELVAQAIALLKNEPMRNFQIDIETDTLVELDEMGEKRSRVEFLQAAGNFIVQATNAAQSAPQMLPLYMQMLLFGVRGFKAGRELEGVFEATMEELDKEQKMKAQMPPQPNPDQIKAQAEAQRAQADLQIEQAKMQMEQQKAQLDAQMEQQKMQFEQQKAQQDAQLAQWKANLEAETKMAVAQLQAENALRIKGMEKSTDLVAYDGAGNQQASALLQNVLAQSNQALAENMAQVVGAIQNSNAQQSEVMANIVAHMTRPKQVMRDANGKIIGVQ
jgi:hypothetical protein